MLTELLTGLCWFYNVSTPPSVVIQNNTFQLYTINKKICPELNPKLDTTFELYTRFNPNEPTYLYLNNVSSIENSHIDFNKNMKIFFHGFLESSESDSAVQIKNKYLEYEDCNVIIVDNRRLLAGPDYLTATLNCDPIGKYSAKFVDFLVDLGLNLSKLHVIGFSLGAQIAGLMGKYLTSGKIARITGLDPAGPIFAKLPESQRLTKNDAEFVDVIHTNANFNGISFDCGDVDVWVNGGSIQPGCDFFSIMKRDYLSILELVLCNHQQSYRMYAQSLIDPKSYQITKCDNYDNYQSGKCKFNNVTYMGVEIDKSSRGDYYLTTGPTALSL